MKKKRLRQVKASIKRVQSRLQEIGPMRPGSLTVQYADPKGKKGPYYQLSYTHKMKSRTQYVRSEFIPEVRKQIASYKRFRRLVDKWVELAIEECRLQMEIDKADKSQ